MSRLSESFEVGGLTVAALSDGAPDRPLTGFFHEVPEAEWTRVLGLGGPDELVPFNFGAFLVRGDGHTTLIDSGFGPEARAMGVPGGGGLLDRIRELGVHPDEVDVIVHTHLHHDHCGWDAERAAEDGTAGRLVFPNATYYVSQRELEYWTGPETADDSTDDSPYAVALRQTGMPANVRLRIDPVVAAGRVHTFEGEHGVTEALTMLPTPGHTPGHCSVLLASGGEHLVVVGDAAHHPVYLEHHNWVPSVDWDRAQSTQSRGVLAALAADRDALVTGGHFAIPTLGRLRRIEGGYRWEQA